MLKQKQRGVGRCRHSSAAAFFWLQPHPLVMPITEAWHSCASLYLLERQRQVRGAARVDMEPVGSADGDVKVFVRLAVLLQLLKNRGQLAHRVAYLPQYITPSN